MELAMMLSRQSHALWDNLTLWSHVMKINSKALVRNRNSRTFNQVIYYIVTVIKQLL